MSTQFDDRLGGEAPQPERPPTDDAIPVTTSAINHPTVFADGVWFCMNLGGTVRMQFLENIPEPANSPTPGLRSRHVGTLAMPIQGFLNMVHYLNQRADDFIKEAALTEHQRGD